MVRGGKLRGPGLSLAAPWLASNAGKAGAGSAAARADCAQAGPAAGTASDRASRAQRLRWVRMTASGGPRLEAGACGGD